MKKDYSVGISAQAVYKKKLFLKVSKIVLLLLMLFISVIYLFLYIMCQRGNFIISLDRNMSNRKNIYLSEDGKLKNKQEELSAGTLDYMDNISIDWIPKEIDTEKDGSHNGSNYIAYSFYIINSGKEDVNYWYEIDIDNSIKNVDKAIRIMIYKNGVPTVYAKANEKTKRIEKGTTKFHSKNIAVLEQRKNFSSNSKDHFTLVVWIEGDDPDCKDDLLGGEIKMHMDITEEHLKEKK